VIVAIDGPAGSGKSTTARRVAARLGWLYLDTGAMYRAVGLAFLNRGLHFTSDAAAALLPDLRLDLQPYSDGLRVLVDGEDVTERLRTTEAAEAASRVSAIPAVRARMVDEQRRIAQAQPEGAVLEGRDIGTVVFPDAEVKVFLVADDKERARRRHAELAASGAGPSLAEVAADLDARDRRDRTRAIAPLRRADDAFELDTTGLTIDQQVERVVALVRARRAKA
jgi:CMP/dCMP kinase